MGWNKVPLRHSSALLQWKLVLLKSPLHLHRALLQYPAVLNSHSLLNICSIFLGFSVRMPISFYSNRFYGLYAISFFLFYKQCITIHRWVTVLVLYCGFGKCVENRLERLYDEALGNWSPVGICLRTLCLTNLLSKVYPPSLLCFLKCISTDLSTTSYV